MSWQPIETAPKDARKRILYFPAIPALDGLAEHICIREDNGGPFRHPTHWMPLPEPPDNQAIAEMRARSSRLGTEHWAVDKS